MGNIHIDVVNHHTKIICRRAVGAGDDQIIEFSIVKNHVAFDQILHDGGTVARRTEANGKRFVHWQGRDDAVRWAAGAIVCRLAFLLLRQLPLGIQFRRRADARVSFACGDQLADFILVQRITFGLVKRPFVIVEFQPFHGVEDCLDRFWRRSVAVGVFYAQNELAAVVTGK